jgi:preprotein translocase subunit SecE
MNTMARTSPAEFARQVRQEVAKVTWPSRKETMTTTAMVFVMVIIASLFFFIADQIFSQLMRLVLSSF